MWELREGPTDATAWLDAAYADRSLVTQVGVLHADHAKPGDLPGVLPNSTATMPGLLVQMYWHAMITDGMDVLDVGSGSEYGTALLATRLSDPCVTSIDIDEYLIYTAAGRLDSIELHPRVTVCDATGPLPAAYDRIVATVAVPPHTHELAGCAAS